MDPLALYDQILELSPPWKTVSVNLEKDTGELVVKVECSERKCPKCYRKCSVYDHRVRRWRHLDTCQFKTIIDCDLPRISCPEHGCITIQAPWAVDHSRYTALFENQVLRAALVSSLSAVSKRLKISWNAVDGIIQRGLARGRSRPRKIQCKHLCVDETKIGPNRDFITVLSNQLGEVIAIADGRSCESLISCFKSIPIHFLNKVATISMDMSPAYQKAVKLYFPRRGEKLIAFDHFHITKMLNDALNQTRKRESRRLPTLKSLNYHQTRFIWLRNQSTLNEDESNLLLNLRAKLSQTAVVWFYKERLREIWQSGTIVEAKKLWRIWIMQALKSNIKILANIAETIHRCLAGILKAMKYRVSNARAEAINCRIKYFGKRATGYRNRERYKRAIMFYLGRLNVYADPL